MGALKRKPKRFNSTYYRRAKHEEPDKHLAGKRRLGEILGRRLDRVRFEVAYPRTDDPEFPYKADLLCQKGGFEFVVEVDGPSHDTRNRSWKDAIRDIWFREYHHLTTVRFTSEEATSRWEMCEDEIWQRIDKKLGSDFHTRGVGTLFCWLQLTRSQAHKS